MSTLYYATLVAISALIIAMLISIVWPRYRIWPPQDGSRLSFIFVWTLTIFAFGAVFLMGIFDWNGLGWRGQFHVVAGGVLIAAGNILALAGIGKLGVSASTGKKRSFVTGGLYRYTRNPQYCGDILILVGWIIMSASAFVIVLALLGIATFLLMPFPEEPWLKERFGDDYIAYMRRTPRFFLL